MQVGRTVVRVHTRRNPLAKHASKLVSEAEPKGVLLSSSLPEAEGLA